MVEEMLSSKRKIESLCWAGDNSPLTVGGSVLTIECYGEPGPNCLVPWFCVKFENGKETRFNGMMIESVGYAAVDAY